MKKFYRPIKVVHIIGSLRCGGAERMLANLALHTDPKYIDITVISLTELGMFGSFLKEKGIRIVGLNAKPLNFFWKLFLLRKILLETQPDILQTWMYHADFIGLILGRLIGIPIILWNIRCANIDILLSHGFKHNFFFKLMTCLSRMPTAVLVNSYAGQQYHKKMGYKAKAWIYMPNGFDTSKFCPSENRKAEFRKSFSIGSEAFVVGVVARCDITKNYMGILQGAVRFIGLYPSAKFMLVGKGVDSKNDEIMNYLEKYSLKSNFILMGETKN